MDKHVTDNSEPVESEMTLYDVAEAVEIVFGTRSLDLHDCARNSADESARSAFVRASLYLMVKSRFEGTCLSGDEARAAKSKVICEVREEIASLLGIDVNEVFRLHHHAAVLRAKDPDFREAVRAMERDLASRHGMVV